MEVIFMSSTDWHAIPVFTFISPIVFSYFSIVNQQLSFYLFVLPLPFPLVLIKHIQLRLND